MRIDRVRVLRLRRWRRGKLIVFHSEVQRDGVQLTVVQVSSHIGISLDVEFEILHVGERHGGEHVQGG